MEADYSLIPVFFFSFLLLTVGEKVGIGIGAVVGAVIGGILVWYIIRCCKKSEKRKKTETQVFLDTQPA